MLQKKQVLALKKKLKINTIFPYILIVFGVIGLLSSATISYEKEQLLKNPETSLLCDINPIYSCGNIMRTEQSQIFGFSNEILGIITFSAIITVGVSMLAGAQFKKWFWNIFLLGMLGSMLFVLWFFYQSVYVIGSLCIFCSIVWFCMWTITTALFAWTIDNKQIGISTKLQKQLFFPAIRKDIVFTWFLLIVIFATLIIQHFWYFYGPKLGF